MLKERPFEDRPEGCYCDDLIGWCRENGKPLDYLSCDICLHELTILTRPWSKRVGICWCYYVERDGFIKIGHSWDLRSRLTGLAKGGVVRPAEVTLGPVNLLAKEEGGYEREQERHRQFKAHHVVGEWFRFEGALKQHIISLPEIKEPRFGER